MRINDLEYKTGLDRATIRYYEKEGMITPLRHENGYRDYSDEDQKQLLKIKLLRQLGMPLSKIKELQQGSTDFQIALTEQIVQLEAKRDKAQRSVQVCKLIQSDGVTYAELNGSYYLNKFSTVALSYPSQGVTRPTQPPFVFHEQLYRPYHPFRHYIARTLDYMLFVLLIAFTELAFFHMRTDLVLLPYFLNILLWIPLEAICYTLFATTPGKWALGIRVDHVDGCKHSFGSAIRRAFGVYRYGLGWGIPIWEIWRIYRSYKDYKENCGLEWDNESEVTYLDFWDHKQKLRLVVVTVLLIALFAGTLFIMESPKHRNDLTIEQFSACYNDYWRRFGYEETNALTDDGKFMSLQPINGVVVEIGGKCTYDNFVYTTKNGKVSGISYSENWQGFWSISAIPKRCETAAVTLLAAAEGENTKQLNRYLEDLRNEIRAALKNGNNEIEFTYKSVVFRWKIEYVNCTINDLHIEDTIEDTLETDGYAAIYVDIVLI